MDWGWAIANQPLVRPGLLTSVLGKDPTTWDVPKLGAGDAVDSLLAAAEEELFKISPLSIYFSCSGACSITAAVAMVLLYL